MPRGWGLELPLGCGLFIAVAITIAVGFGGGDVVRRWLVIGRHVIVGRPNHVLEFGSVERLT
jgi:hypothetical protein